MHLNLDKQNPDSVAIKDDSGREITYGELIQESADFFEHFEKGDFVFHLTRNTIPTFVAHYSFVSNGVISLVLSSGIDPQLLENLLDVYAPNFIVTDDPEFSLPESVEAMATSTAGKNLITRLNDKKHVFSPELEFLMSTSGSTGSPKLVKYKKGNLHINALNVAYSFGWSDKEYALGDLPLNYTMGLNVVNAHLATGAKVFLTNYNVITPQYWEIVRNEKITNITGVPFTFEMMKRLKVLNQHFPYLKTLSQGGGKMDHDLFNDIAEYAKKNDMRFIASFGTTETSARMMLLDPEKALEKTGSIGKPIRDGKVYLIDENNEKIDQPFTNGELVYEGPNVTMGYAVKLSDLEKEDEFQGVYRTGDLAYFDEEGFYYIVGRLKRFIKVSGKRIGLDEVERLIKKEYDNHPAAVVGEDELLKVIVEEDFPFEDRELRKNLARKIEVNPLNIKIFRLREIPLNDSGKTLYAKINEQIGE